MEVAHFEEKVRRNAKRKRKTATNWAALAKQEYIRFHHGYELKVWAEESIPSNRKIWAAHIVNVCRGINKMAATKTLPWSQRLSRIAAELNQEKHFENAERAAMKQPPKLWKQVYQQIMMHEARNRRFEWHRCFARIKQLH